MIQAEKIYQDLELIRKKSPLVHNITNYVVMNNTANALLAIGASPVMAHAEDEVSDMVDIASSLVINMGTLSEHWVDAMMQAGARAKSKKIPIVFDPVGVGATAYRTQTARQIIKICKPQIIRGNASEIMSLVDEKTKTKGVDSMESAFTGVDAAKELAVKNKAVVVISGELDFITDGKELISIHNGSSMMPRVTGMGCTATALMGAFAAVNSNLLEAAAHTMAVMGITGELAAKKSAGPASLQVNFIDQLYNLSENDIKTHLKAKYEKF